MRTNKKYSQKKQTIKNRIHNYISNKQDICCEENVDRKLVIEQIIETYKKICKQFNEPNEYLSYIDNDLVLFIGYYVYLKKNKDKEGMKLWNKLDKITYENKKMYKNRILSQEKIELVLKEVPLYYLLSLLGYASYRESLWRKWK